MEHLPWGMRSEVFASMISNPFPWLVLSLVGASVACSSSPARRGVNGTPDSGADGAVTSTGGRAAGGSGGTSPTSGGAGGTDSGPVGSGGVVIDASIGEDASGTNVDASSPVDASDGSSKADVVEAGRAFKFVFVSSGVYSGNLGGLDGADAKCQALADAANLGGTYRAWLSDATGSPATRFTRPAEDYVLTNSTTVFAHGWAGLTGGPALSLLNLTEVGGPPPSIGSQNRCAGLAGGSATWGSTTSDGTASPDVPEGLHTCENWTSASAPAASAVGFGDPTGVSGTWTGFCSTGDDVCTMVAALNCFEQ
jgi:hypothetical protein